MNFRKYVYFPPWNFIWEFSLASSNRSQRVMLCSSVRVYYACATRCDIESNIFSTIFITNKVPRCASLTKGFSTQYIISWFIGICCVYLFYGPLSSMLRACLAFRPHLFYVVWVSLVSNHSASPMSQFSINM